MQAKLSRDALLERPAPDRSSCKKPFCCFLPLQKCPRQATQLTKYFIRARQRELKATWWGSDFTISSGTGCRTRWRSKLSSLESTMKLVWKKAYWKRDGIQDHTSCIQLLSGNCSRPNIKAYKRDHLNEKTIYIYRCIYMFFSTFFCSDMS